MGYHRAGFDVVGVDWKPQPRYPFRFWQADALAIEPWVFDAFDAVHASPPCQAFTAAGQIWGSRKGPSIDRHPDYIAAAREKLRASGLPYVIENVERAPLVDAVTICGLSLGLNVRRHRLFRGELPAPRPALPFGA